MCRSYITVVAETGATDSIALGVREDLNEFCRETASRQG
jgi:hypothetical protein